MPSAAKLKVFRTPIGFHDAYVAAPSRKAALAAWGSEKDLFARGDAEIVTDPALTAAPLAAPGVVVKRSRGTAAEQVAALPPDKPKPRPPAPADQPPPEPARRKPARPKPAPRPSRSALDRAEAAEIEVRERQAANLRALAEREAALVRERRALEKSQAQETARVTSAREKAEAAYRQAIEAWRGRT